MLPGKYLAEDAGETDHIENDVHKEKSEGLVIIGLVHRGIFLLLPVGFLFLDGLGDKNQGHQQGTGLQNCQGIGDDGEKIHNWSFICW